MQSVYCRACGTHIQASAQFCPSCGARQLTAKASVTGSSDPVSARNVPSDATAPTPDEIDALIWQSRFGLIDKAGGAKLPRIWSLPIKEIFRIRWNLWAFLFGPIYYAVKGMWKKGLTLSGLCVLIMTGASILLEAVGLDAAIIGLLPAGIMSGQANVSYYRKIKEGFTGWW